MTISPELDRVLSLAAANGRVPGKASDPQMTDADAAHAHLMRACPFYKTAATGKDATQWTPEGWHASSSVRLTPHTAEASTVPEPHGKPGGPGLWHHKGMQAPPYIQHVAGELMKHGKSESEAYHMAVGIVENWSHGHTGHAGKGGKPQHVHADVRAAAAANIAKWEELRGKAHASHGDAKHDVRASNVELAVQVKGYERSEGGRTEEVHPFERFATTMSSFKTNGSYDAWGRSTISSQHSGEVLPKVGRARIIAEGRPEQHTVHPHAAEMSGHQLRAHMMQEHHVTPSGSDEHVRQAHDRMMHSPQMGHVHEHGFMSGLTASSLDRVLALALGEPAHGELHDHVHPHPADMSPGAMREHLMHEHHVTPSGGGEHLVQAHARLHSQGMATHLHMQHPHAGLTGSDLDRVLALASVRGFMRRDDRGKLEDVHPYERMSLERRGPSPEEQREKVEKWWYDQRGHSQVKAVEPGTENVMDWPSQGVSQRIPGLERGAGVYGRDVGMLGTVEKSGNMWQGKHLDSTELGKHPTKGGAAKELVYYHNGMAAKYKSDPDKIAALELENEKLSPETAARTDLNEEQRRLVDAARNRAQGLPDTYGLKVPLESLSDAAVRKAHEDYGFTASGPLDRLLSLAAANNPWGSTTPGGKPTGPIAYGQLRHQPQQTVAASPPLPPRAQPPSSEELLALSQEVRKVSDDPIIDGAVRQIKTAAEQVSNGEYVQALHSLRGAQSGVRSVAQITLGKQIPAANVFSTGSPPAELSTRLAAIKSIQDARADFIPVMQHVAQMIDRIRRFHFHGHYGTIAQQNRLSFSAYDGGGPLELVLGAVKGYERMVRGREEEVRPYNTLRQLKALAGPKAATGHRYLTDEDWNKGSEAFKAIDPAKQADFAKHVGNAHEAMKAGDHLGAEKHMASAVAALGGSSHASPEMNRLMMAAHRGTRNRVTQSKGLGKESLDPQRSVADAAKMHDKAQQTQMVNRAMDEAKGHADQASMEQLKTALAEVERLRQAIATDQDQDRRQNLGIHIGFVTAGMSLALIMSGVELPHVALAAIALLPEVASELVDYAADKARARKNGLMPAGAGEARPASALGKVVQGAKATAKASAKTFVPTEPELKKPVKKVS